jgi:hypothetical protein
MLADSLETGGPIIKIKNTTTYAVDSGHSQGPAGFEMET